MLGLPLTPGLEQLLLVAPLLVRAGAVEETGLSPAGLAGARAGAPFHPVGLRGWHRAPFSTDR